LSERFAVTLTELSLDRFWRDCAEIAFHPQQPPLRLSRKLAEVVLSAFIELGYKRGGFSALPEEYRESAFGAALVQVLLDFGASEYAQCEPSSWVVPVAEALEELGPVPGERLLALSNRAMEQQVHPPVAATASAGIENRRRGPGSRVFIASSTEGLRVAEAIQSNLDHEYECTLWTQGPFQVSALTLESLERLVENVDFAVIAVTPDDVTVSRGVVSDVARDNVILEAGLFLGALGRDRTFLVMPRDLLKLPSDLAGLTVASYRTDRSDGNMRAALGAACFELKAAMG
jgi:predicted nucleotide-binding protein